MQYRGIAFRSNCCAFDSSCHQIDIPQIHCFDIPLFHIGQSVQHSNLCVCAIPSHRSNGQCGLNGWEMWRRGWKSILTHSAVSFWRISFDFDRFWVVSVQWLKRHLHDDIHSLLEMPKLTSTPQCGSQFGCFYCLVRLRLVRHWRDSNLNFVNARVMHKISMSFVF